MLAERQHVQAETRFPTVGEPARLVSAAGELAEMLDEAAIMLKLVGDNQLAVLEVGNRRVVRRTTMQGARYFLLKSQVSTFQVGNGCLRHHSLRHCRIFESIRTRNGESVFDLNQGQRGGAKRRFRIDTGGAGEYKPQTVSVSVSNQ
jgi:hypothetical protein